MAANAKRGKERDKVRDGQKGSFGKSPRRKDCHFCKDKVAEVDYKNVNQLRRYLSERGKIRSPRMTGACRRHQRQVAVAIKRAREMALLPYVADPGPPHRSPRPSDRSERP